MKKNLSKIILTLIFLQGFMPLSSTMLLAQDNLLAPVQNLPAQKTNGLNYFNLANIVDNFFNLESKERNKF